MSLFRSLSQHTMVSCANSTSELNRGLSHILLDASGALPDDLESLQDWLCIDLRSHTIWLIPTFLYLCLWVFMYANISYRVAPLKGCLSTKTSNPQGLMNIWKSYPDQPFANLQEMERQLADLEAKTSSARAFDYTDVPPTIWRFQWDYRLRGILMWNLVFFSTSKELKGIKSRNIYPHSTPKRSALVQATCSWFPGHVLGAAGNAVAGFETAPSEIMWNQIIFLSVWL